MSEETLGRAKRLLAKLTPYVLSPQFQRLLFTFLLKELLGYLFNGGYFITRSAQNPDDRTSTHTNVQTFRQNPANASVRSRLWGTEWRWFLGGYSHQMAVLLVFSWDISNDERFQSTGAGSTSLSTSQQANSPRSRLRCFQKT